MKKHWPRATKLYFVFFPNGVVANWTGAARRKDAIATFVAESDFDWKQHRKDGFSVHQCLVAPIAFMCK